MFTNNYLTYREMMFFGSTNKTFVNCEGISQTSCSAEYSWWGDIGNVMTTAYCKEIVGQTSSSSKPTKKAAYSGVYFGTGSTPATKNDYKLESPITSGLSITNPGGTSVDESNGRYTYVVPFLVKNTSEVEVNIWEIGVFGETIYYKSSGAYNVQNVLFERTVLSEPITIAPGEVKVVTYRLTINQTLNVE
jgi:hypothetical protein